MKLEKFNFEAHEQIFRDLLKGRNMDVDELIQDVPIHGYIVFDDENNAVAAGFLRFIEGPYGLLDSYISRPGASSRDRNEAFDLITESLIQLSKRFSIRKLLAFSLERSLMDRAVSHGFQRVPYDFCALSFKGENKCHF